MVERFSDLETRLHPEAASPKPLQPTQSRGSLVRIAAVRVDGDRLIDDLYTLIDPDEVFFAFLGRAAETLIFGGPWKKVTGLKPQLVYLRTADGIYRTHFRSIATLASRLSDHFSRVNKGVIVNLTRVRWVELSREKHKSLGFAFENEKWGPHAEWVIVSRKATSVIRDQLGLPARS